MTGCRQTISTSATVSALIWSSGGVLGAGLVGRVGRPLRRLAGGRAGAECNGQGQRAGRCAGRTDSGCRMPHDDLLSKRCRCGQSTRDALHCASSTSPMTGTSGRSSASAPPPRIGISSCLLGEAVRHDGGHKRDAYLVETLGPLVEWVPVCPEVEVGLGTPREPIRLVRDASRSGGVRLVSRSGKQLTARMQRFARGRLRALARAGLSGYILKKDSPSCGMERVKVWHGDAERARGAERPRHLRGGAPAAAPEPAGGGGGTPARSRAPRELLRAGVRLPASAGPLLRALARRRPWCAGTPPGS